jgi:hypothetical protein
VDFKHAIGVVATDSISGFTGVIVGRAQYITSCNQYLLTPIASAAPSVWIDEQRLVAKPLPRKLRSVIARLLDGSRDEKPGGLPIVPTPRHP